MLGEDRIFSIGALLYSKSCIYMNDIMYHYLIHPFSSTAILPLYTQILIDEVHEILTKLNLHDFLFDEFETFKKNLFVDDYNREYNETKKKKIVKKAKNNLNKVNWLIFKKEVISNNIPKNIFSIQNKYYFALQIKVKVLTIFGFSFIIKKCHLR